MFLPSVPGMSMLPARLPAVDESIWYPAIPGSEAIVHTETGLSVGLNTGLIFTVGNGGVITSLCYYRISAAMSPSGTIALWQITPFTETLLVQVDYTGHSGTGWQVIVLDEPISVSSSQAYCISHWMPAISGNVVTPLTSYYFAAAGHLSEPNQLVYAVMNNGTNDSRGFIWRNGLISVGAFERPVDTYAADNFWIDVIFHGSPVSVPPDQPLVIKWPIPDGWPTFSNTGPDPDTVFTVVNEFMNTSADGQLIENMELRGGLTINHNNVTVRNCKIRNAFPYVSVIAAGTTGATYEDCSLDGVGRQNLNSCGIVVAGTDVTISRCVSFHVENGFAIYGHPFPANVLIEDCFVSNLRAQPGLPHYDGIQMDGGQVNITLRHNTLFNENSQAAVIMLDNEGGDIDNILVEDNYLGGGAYPFYIVDDFTTAPVTNLRYYNNKVNMGLYGYWYITGTSPDAQGNQYYSHGKIFDTPPPGGFVDGQLVYESFRGMAILGGGFGNDEADGLTLGTAFTPSVDGAITSVNYYRPYLSDTTLYKVGVWRFTGSTLSGGTELLYSQTFDNIFRDNLQNLALTTPVAVNAGDRLVVGVWISPNSNGTVWYAVENGVFWPDPVPSQWDRLTAYSNSGVALDGFVGGNGLYAYGPDLAPPVNASANDAYYSVDPVFVAAWEVDDPGGGEGTVGDASNTGVPPGTLLTASGDITSSSNGQIIQDKNVTGIIVVNHNDVIIRRCRITCGEDDYGIRIMGSGALVEDCEIISAGGYGGNSGIAGNGIYRRLNIHGFENGLAVWEPNGGIFNSYIWDIRGSPTAHKDGIQIDGAIFNWEIAYNTIITDGDCVSCVMINNGFGAIDDIRVHHNHLIGSDGTGGQYTVYSDEGIIADGFSGEQITNVSFTNNRMQSGFYGYHLFRNNTPVFTGNTDYDTGAPLT